METYVTLLSTMSYLPGVLALNEALHRVGALYPLLVALSAQIPSTIEPLLQQAGMLVTTLPESIEIPVQLREVAGYWGNTFDKLHIFGLTEFSKLVYVDSDMIVLTNIDELFEKPHMSAVAAGQLVHPDWKRLNSGLMVIEPENGLPEKIASTLQKALSEATLSGRPAIGDQDLINAYYSTWPNTPELHLDDGYNIFQCHLDDYIEKHGYHLPDDTSGDGRVVKIVHFVGPHKPWMTGASSRHYLNVAKRMGAIKWERRLFSTYKKLLKESSISGS